MTGALAGYVARRFGFWLAAVLSSLALVIYLLDTVELVRRAQRFDVKLSVLMNLSLLKLPHLMMDVVPFAVLFAAMICFWRLARSQELTVIRAAGVSVWRFLTPVILVALLVGATRVTLLNPVAATLSARYEASESALFRGRSASSAAAQNGFWLRQASAGGGAVIHALRVVSSRMELFDVVIWTYERPRQATDPAERFASRIDARAARLEAGAWVLTDATVTRADLAPRFEPNMRLPTDMTLAQIQDAFAAPETIPVWELPAFVGTLERAGFSGHRHLLHLHRLLASPLLLAAMVLIAATVSLRPPRRGGTLSMTLLGLGAGFLVFFASNLVAALGLSRAIPVHLAAWSPATITALLGAAILFHQEDG
jgi:lipopolysaccharide export system permease protein